MGHGIKGIFLEKEKRSIVLTERGRRRGNRHKGSEIERESGDLFVSINRKEKEGIFFMSLNRCMSKEK